MRAHEPSALVTIHRPCLAQFATILICPTLISVLANSMSQLMGDRQVEQSASNHAEGPHV